MSLKIRLAYAEDFNGTTHCCEEVPAHHDMAATQHTGDCQVQLSCKNGQTELTCQTGTRPAAATHYCTTALTTRRPCHILRGTQSSSAEDLLSHDFLTLAALMLQRPSNSCSKRSTGVSTTSCHHSGCAISCCTGLCLGFLHIYVHILRALKFSCPATGGNGMLVTVRLDSLESCQTMQEAHGTWLL